MPLERLEALEIFSIHSAHCATRRGIAILPEKAWRQEHQLKGRWLHSDIKDVAYPFTRAMFKDIIKKGHLE